MHFIKLTLQKEREKTKGSKWYNMEAPEMTEEKKNDLAVIQMRKALDPKRFYKNNDTVAVPKYFQVIWSAGIIYKASVYRPLNEVFENWFS